MLLNSFQNRIINSKVTLVNGQKILPKKYLFLEIQNAKSSMYTLKKYNSDLILSKKKLWTIFDT